MTNEPAVTHFLNVDLDIHSKDDLQPLAQAFGEKVHVLWVGRVRRTHYAHFELAGLTNTPDSTIRAFCRLISSLPKKELDLWHAAKRRDFSIGVQAVAGSPVIDFAIKPEILRLASDLGARIVFTVYPPELPWISINGEPTFRRPLLRSPLGTENVHQARLTGPHSFDFIPDSP